MRPSARGTAVVCASVLLLACMACMSEAQKPVPPRAPMPANNCSCTPLPNRRQPPPGAIEAFAGDADWDKARKYQGILREFCNADEASRTVSVICNEGLHYCEIRGGLMIDFTLATEERSDKYIDSVSMHLLGTCGLAEAFLPEQSLRRSSYSLASWAREFGRLLGEQGESPESIQEKCDITFDGPVMLTKADAHANIYHGICDFANIHFSMFVRGWGDIDPKDLQIGYFEAPYPSSYNTRMGDLYKAFSSNPILFSQKWRGKRVCFKDVVFSTLPRRGDSYYYNMPLRSTEHGCRNGPKSLFPLFSQRVRERVLDTPLVAPTHDTIKLALLSRNHGTGYTSGVCSDAKGGEERAR